MSLDAVLSAVADPTRRAMLPAPRTRSGDRRSLAALFPVSRPAVSRHLRVLRDTGLVRPIASSRTSPYELVPGPLFLVEAWVRDLADRWTASPPARS